MDTRSQCPCWDVPNTCLLSADARPLTMSTAGNIADYMAGDQMGDLITELVVQQIQCEWQDMVCHGPINTETSVSMHA